MSCFFLPTYIKYVKILCKLFTYITRINTLNEIDNESTKYQFYRNKYPTTHLNLKLIECKRNYVIN